MPKRFEISELQRRLIKNSGFNFTNLAITSIASFLVSVVIARTLHPTEAGIYFYLVWLIGTLSLIINLGLPNTLTRFISEAQSRSDRTLLQTLLSRASVFTIGWGVLVSLIVLGLAPVLPLQESARPYLWIIPLASISLALSTTFGSVVLGLQKIKYLALAALVSQPLLVISLYFLAQVANLTGLILVTGASYLVTAFILYWSFRTDMSWPTKAWDETKRRFISYAKTVSAITFIDAIVWQRSEVLFLGVLSGSEAVAYYAVAFGLAATAMKLVPGAFSGILMPAITETYLTEETWVLRRRFWRSTGLLLALVIPMVVAGYFLAPLVIPLLYGHNYQPVIDVFRIVLLGGGFGAVASVAATVFYGTERPNFILKFGVMVALINIGLDFFLINQYGLVGAAWANTISQAVGSIGGVAYAGWTLK